jgi:LPXTG-motif cell wall-anchored protein
MSDTLGTGDGIELGAGGFQASEAVLVGFAEDPTGVSTVTASAAGRASATVEVPASKNGKVTAYLYGTSSKRGVKQTLTLTSLPETGTDSSLPTLLGIFLVVSGVLIVARRRLVH